MTASSRLIAFLVLGAVTFTAIFGFSVMTGTGHAIVRCFGGAPGSPCVTLAPIEHFASHLHAFQNISTAIVGMFLFAILLLYLAVAYKIGRGGRLGAKHSFVFEDARSRAASYYSFLNWLALHEKRDPSSFCALNG